MRDRDGDGSLTEQYPAGCTVTILQTGQIGVLVSANEASRLLACELADGTLLQLHPDAVRVEG